MKISALSLLVAVKGEIFSRKKEINRFLAKPKEILKIS